MYNVVDHFLILESNSTFTGRFKPYKYLQHQNLFEFAKSKILYKPITVRQLKEGEDPFELEGDHRKAMNALIKEAGAQKGDLVLMMDVDEIPSAPTIRLIKSCQGVPMPLHLQLRNYLYSFEFFVDNDSWRGKVDEHPAPYTHSRKGDLILADSGWHCSFCFRYLQDFAFKMGAYSHADRVHSQAILDPRRIQDVICNGSDIYDMLPEVHSFQDLMAKWRPIAKQHTTVGLPAYLVEHSQEFRFLLPGGCIREPDP